MRRAFNWLPFPTPALTTTSKRAISIAPPPLPRHRSLERARQLNYTGHTECAHGCDTLDLPPSG